MTYLSWSPDLDTGIPGIDNQHKQLMDFINRLHDARQHADRQGVVAVVDDLVEYTLSHFAFEECLMEDAGYEFVRGHKKVHELFVRRVASFSDRLKRGEDISHELHSLLHRWLFSHIRTRCGRMSSVRRIRPISLMLSFQLVSRSRASCSAP